MCEIVRLAESIRFFSFFVLNSNVRDTPLYAAPSELEAMTNTPTRTFSPGWYVTPFQGLEEIINACCVY
jgi:hypothetical protein